MPLASAHSVDQLAAQERCGFLLTASSRDLTQGKVRTTELRYWIKTDEGALEVLVQGERPVLFVSQSQAEVVADILARETLVVESKPLSLTTFDHRAVLALYTDTIHAHFRLQDLLVATNITMFEHDIRLHERYLMERFITGGVRVIGRKDDRKAYPALVQARLKADDYLPQLTMLSLDIETTLQGELLSVGLVGNEVAEVLMIGTPEPADMRILWFSDEKSLLRGLLTRLQDIDPDVIIGWNVVNFDCRVLLKRYAKYGIRFALGRDGAPPHWREAAGQSDQGYIQINGRVVVDGIMALKTGMYQFDEFSLEHVSHVLLGRGKKVKTNAENRTAEILYNFQHDKPALAAYNLEDCQLVLDIFQSTNILDFLVFRSQITGLPLDKQGGSVAAFTNLYLPKLHRGGYIAPNLPADGGLASPGGYVMDSRPGLYRQVLVLDFKSLYPSIIRTFKIDPMGLIEGLKSPENAISGFRGGLFHREKHYLPDIIEQLWMQRDIAKSAKDQPKSQAIKILMNSFYGVLGSGGCRFYDTRLASSITLRGHEIMQQTRAWIEAEGYEVIYGDTDSTFVWLREAVSDHAAWDVGDQLARLINARWQTTIQQEHGLESALEIEFETYYRRFLMPTIRGAEQGSKKRYAGLPLQRDGTESNLVFKGLESVRSDWTPLAKQFQEALYARIFADEDPSHYIQQIVDETLAGKHDDGLVYRKRIRRPLRMYVKNIPPQIRAAKEADAKNRALGKPLAYQNRGWIRYVITLDGPQTLEYQESRIDYWHYIQKQLKPIADSILPFLELDKDFDRLTNQQTELF